MADGYLVDAKTLRELKELRTKVKAMTVTPFAPVNRSKTREVTTYPAERQRYQVLSVLDDNGTVGFDWVRIHG